jgi:carbon starvation protein CstA/uncharacterized short protein YbdD (DUF466 family)
LAARPEAFWYHFAILFEALFILTALDAGTRAGRFMIQDLLGHIYAPLGRTESVFSNIVATLLCVAGWGWFVYQGTVDPLGGVNTIWPLFGISNQMLAGIALLLATTILIKLKRERYAWVTLAPTAWLLVCTLTAGWMKAFSSDPRIGFYALANKYSDAAASGTILAPAKSIAEMQRVAFNNYVCGTLTVMFVVSTVWAREGGRCYSGDVVAGLVVYRCDGLSLEECMECALSTASQIRSGWLRILGAPDYRAYLAHHAANHSDSLPLSEREFVATYMERRYNGRGAQRCC